MKTVNDLNEEQKRYVREGFDNDEELCIYDMLFQDNLSKNDIKQIKSLAKEILTKIKALISEMDSPFDKEATVASIQNEIRNILYADLPDANFDNIDIYRNNIYEYLKTIYSVA